MPIKIYLIGTIWHKIYPNTTKCGVLTYIGLLHLSAKFHGQLINISPGIGKEVTDIPRFCTNDFVNFIIYSNTLTKYEIY